MQSPNWFKLASGVLIGNAALVSFLSLPPGDHPPEDAEQVSQTSETDAEVLNATSTSNDSIESGDQGALAGQTPTGHADPANQRPSLPLAAEGLATEMPEVPSLSLPAEDYRSNPVFQEIEKMLLEQPGRDAQGLGRSPTDEAPPMPMATINEAYCQKLSGRMNTVMHLCKSAQGLVTEASILAQAGDLEGSRELLGIVTRLRETAAELLVREL